MSSTNHWRLGQTAAAVCFVLGGVAVSQCGAATFQENFVGDPRQRGWKVFGDGSLFVWDAQGQHLTVTWDSRRPNSYFYRPLGTVLAKSDDFSLAFGLQLSDIAVGVDPARPFTFELAVGLLNFHSATNANFSRGAGIHPIFGPRNLVEFDYFPDSGFGATVAPTVASTNNQIRFSDNHPLEMNVGDVFHVEMTYAASNQVLRTRMTRNGQPFGLPPGDTIADLALADFPDFRVDALSISSFSDQHADGSILAHGVVDDVTLSLPPPPVSDLSGGFVSNRWQVRFSCHANWFYMLQRTADLQSWQAASPKVAGTTTNLVLEDANPPSNRPAFYRVLAERP